MTYTLKTPEETHTFGVNLASVLRAGDVLILAGPLGAGKTALTQGIGAGLGITRGITSPTFVIAMIHDVNETLQLVHVDAYRLGGVAELDDLDLDADIDQSVTVIEWGAGKAEQLSDSHLRIQIDRCDDDSRNIALIGHGGDWEQRIQKFEETVVC